MGIYTFEQLRKEYNAMTSSARVCCTLETEIVGGMSADDKGLRAYIEHHMHLSGEEADRAFDRIKAEELGEKDTTPENGELNEKKVYGITVIRRDEYGPWLGDWMVKACIKAATSRLGLFMSKRGSKGDIAEMGRVFAMGASLAVPAHPERIHLIHPDGGPITTYFKEFKGRISGPSGSMSIVSQKECAPPGSSFSFEFRWFAGKLKEAEIVKIFASAMNIGLGSAKAFECGKFRVDSLDVLEPKKDEE